MAPTRAEPSHGRDLTLRRPRRPSVRARKGGTPPCATGKRTHIVAPLWGLSRAPFPPPHSFPLHSAPGNAFAHHVHAPRATGLPCGRFGVPLRPPHAPLYLEKDDLRVRTACTAFPLTPSERLFFVGSSCVAIKLKTRLGQSPQSEVSLVSPLQLDLHWAWSSAPHRQRPSTARPQFTPRRALDWPPMPPLWP